MNKKVSWKRILIQIIVLPVVIIVGSNLLLYLVDFIGLETIGNILPYLLIVVSILFSLFSLLSSSLVQYNRYSPKLKRVTVDTGQNSEIKNKESYSTDNSSSEKPIEEESKEKRYLILHKQKEVFFQEQ